MGDLIGGFVAGFLTAVFLALRVESRRRAEVAKRRAATRAEKIQAFRYGHDDNGVWERRPDDAVARYDAITEWLAREDQPMPDVF